MIHLHGWFIVNFWIALALLIVLMVLWVQGWWAGRELPDWESPNPWGVLFGSIDVRLLNSQQYEDRSVKILPTTDWWFRRPNGELIRPTVGRESDGQSIPPFAWLLMGMSPLTGKSRSPAIGGHDEECYLKRRSAEAAHNIMYEMMRARGMRVRGPILHAVLLNWGSKWPRTTNATS